MRSFFMLNQAGCTISKKKKARVFFFSHFLSYCLSRYGSTILPRPARFYPLDDGAHFTPFAILHGLGIRWRIIKKEKCRCKIVTGTRKTASQTKSVQRRSSRTCRPRQLQLQLQLQNPECVADMTCFATESTVYGFE